MLSSDEEFNNAPVCTVKHLHGKDAHDNSNCVTNTYSWHCTNWQFFNTCSFYWDLAVVCFVVWLWIMNAAHSEGIRKPNGISRRLLPHGVASHVVAEQLHTIATFRLATRNATRLNYSLWCIIYLYFVLSSFALISWHTWHVTRILRIIWSTS